MTTDSTLAVGGATVFANMCRPGLHAEVLFMTWVAV